MFREFTEERLNWWKSLSQEEKDKCISEYTICIAADIDIEIGNNSEVFEKHSYYKITGYTNKLHNEIDIMKIGIDEIQFYINLGRESQIVNVKVNEEKIITYGVGVYSKYIKFKVNNIYYGEMLEL